MSTQPLHRNSLTPSPKDLERSFVSGQLGSCIFWVRWGMFRQNLLYFVVSAHLLDKLVSILYEIEIDAIGNLLSEAFTGDLSCDRLQRHIISQNKIQNNLKHSKNFDPRLCWRPKRTTVSSRRYRLAMALVRSHWNTLIVVIRLDMAHHSGMTGKMETTTKLSLEEIKFP